MKESHSVYKWIDHQGRLTYGVNGQLEYERGGKVHNVGSITKPLKYKVNRLLTNALPMILAPTIALTPEAPVTPAAVQATEPEPLKRQSKF